MSSYVIRRLLLGIVTFFGITLMVFLLSNLAPGSPLDVLLASDGMTADELARREAQLGLDQPLTVQYVTWLKELVRGNLGYSYSSYRPVKDLIFERLGATLLLTVTAILLSYVVGIPLGLISAVKPYSARDYTASAFAFVMTGMPGFFLGMLLIYVFAVKLQWLPMGGMFGADGSRSMGSVIAHLVLPALAIAMPEIGKVLRYVRSNMLEILQEDYVRTARAKGVREGSVILAHGFRNSLIPIVTVFSGSIPFMFGGSVVVEKVFSWPGLGSLMISSINARDYPVIMGLSVIIAVVVLATNLIVDLVYGLLDPRITYS